MPTPDYKQLFESSPVLSILLDRDFRIAAASDAFLAATMTTREAVVGKEAFEVFPSDPSRPEASGERVVRELLDRVLAERRPQRLRLQRYDVPRPQAQGGGFERRYWTAQFVPLLGPDGEVTHIHCVSEDATDRAREERLGKLWAVEGVGVLFFDRQGTLISASDTFLRWSGYTPEDVAAGGLTWRTFTPAEYLEVSLAELDRLLATGRIGPYEKEYITKDGRRRWMLFVGGRLDDGTIAELALDVTERKAAEEAKRAAEERYRTLIESLDAGFCVVEMIYDAEGRPHDYRFLEVNPAFEKQTGMRDATGKTMREHAPGHEQHWFDVYGSIAETGGAVRFVQEARALGRWYDVFAFRIGGKGSRKVGVLFYDITERVLAQRALQDEARRKDEFLATLAHELRNPLAPIRNAVSLLQLMSDEKAELRRVGDLIDRQVTQLARLVDDLLDVSRITFGKVSLQRAPVDLREVAKDAVATSEPLLAEKSHRLRLELGNEPFWVEGDRVRLAQVVSNLLNNAARYTPPGGRITLKVAAADSEARIAVEDNGIGIEPSQLERVFEPFAQVDRGEAAGAGGIGIGLALAKALVELHGGRISAHSAGGGSGSRFVIGLPRIAAPRPKTVAHAVPRDKRRRRLLVVDDNVDAASSQADLLRLLGHEVEVAYNGEDALEKAKAFSPEIVLLDLGMPGMDGFEVARRLRAAPGDKPVKLVAQTGWGQEEDRRRTREAGFDAHLAKPVDMASLQQLL
jgi:PAS domain S-box-containing protein